MKKTILPILLVTAVLFSLQCCVSCSPTDSDVEEEENQEPEKPHLDPGTYQFIASPIKGSWEEGDKIYVHGSYGQAAVTITLGKAEISADGKTASVELGKDITDFYADPDGLYAAWPAEAIKEEDGLMSSAITFTDFLIPIAVAYQKDKRFEFVDATAGLHFKVTDGSDEYAIAGNKRQGLRLTSFYVDYTSQDPYFRKPRDDAYPFRYGRLENGEATLWFPGGVTIKGGYSIYFKKDGVWSKVFSVEDDTKFSVGEFNDLGDITQALKAYDGPDPKMPEMGEMTKYSVKVNELSGICLNEDASGLWGLGDGSEIASLSFEGEVLHKASLKTTKGSSIDSEAISRNYDTGDLLIGGEANFVGYIPFADIHDIFKESSFKGVVALEKIADASKFGNSGIEGMTYYKDGLAYAGTQTGSNLYCYELATQKVLWMKPLRQMHPSITEIADLCYDPITGWLWIIDSESHRFFALSGDAETLYGGYLLRTQSNEESICVDHIHGCIWVGDDYGSTSYLYKYEFPELDNFKINN